jgi:hypothetical protein
MIAKTFIETGRYGFPISSRDVLLFAGEIGVGPALILPTALLTRIFGPESWVPGLTALTIFVLQMAVLGAILRRAFVAWRVMLYLSVTLLALFVVSVFAPYVPHLIGEPTTTGYLMIAAAILAIWPDDVRMIAIAGLMMSLAFLSKLIALFGCVGIGAIYLVKHIDDAPVRRCMILTTAAAALPILFEAFKIATLGVGEYIAYWREFLHFARTYHVSPDHRLTTALNLLTGTYQLGWPHLIVLATATFAMLWRWRRTKAGTYAIMLYGGATIHLAYVVMISQVWSRFFWPDVAMLIFVAATPLLVIPSTWIAFGTAAGMIALAAPLSSIAKSYAMQMLDTDGWIKNEQRDLLDQLSANPDATLVARSWHSSFEIFYLMANRRDWRFSSEIEDARRFEGIFFFNDQFIPKDDIYKTIVGRCTDMLPHAKKYKAFRCTTPP